MIKPKISILVPTYNRSSLLKQAIKSILKQSYADFEIIVVDNNSSDDTEAVVMQFTDGRIRYLKNTANVGPIRNHNIALSLAKGEYIHMFSDDDLMLENNLALKVDILEKNENIGLVHSNINIIGADGLVSSPSHWASSSKYWSRVKSSPVMKGADCYDILYNDWNFIAMPTVMIRRSILDSNNLEFNNQLKYLVDWDLWIKCCLHCDLYFVDETLVSYRVHNNNETSLIDKNNYELELLLIKLSLLAFNSEKIDKNKSIQDIHQSVLNQMRLLYSDSVKTSPIKSVLRRALAMLGT